MYDPQDDDDATRQADAVDATDMAPTVMSTPDSGAVVDAFAWSQEDGSGAEPEPYVDDPYDQDPGTTRRVAVSTTTAVPGRRTPTRWPRIALIVGSVVALIAVVGALFSLARTEHEEAPDAPVTSTGVVPPVLSSSLPISTPAPPPVVTTTAPPPTTTVPPITTTTTTAPPPTTTTTTAPPTTTTTAPPTTTTAPPSSSEPPTTTAPPTTTTVPMTTEYLTIPFVPVPIPITVPQN